MRDADGNHFDPSDHGPVAVSPHKPGHGKSGKPSRWVECGCDAGVIGAMHCEKCNGLGGRWEAVRPKKKHYGRRRR